MSLRYLLSKLRELNFIGKIDAMSGVEKIIKLRSINHREEIHHARFFLVEITRRLDSINTAFQ